MTTDTVASGQESSAIAMLNSSGAGPTLFQSSVARATFIDVGVRLPLLNDSARIVETVCDSDFDSACHSGGRTAPLIGDLVIYVLLATLILVLVIALVVVPDNGLLLSDPIGFARGE